MSLNEASKTRRRRLKVMDIDNYYGKQRKRQCEENETREYIIQCKQMAGRD